jgi:DNA-binding XRE family transcriptional regulator
MNSLKTYREQAFLGKAELARKAGISTETIGRIEKGKSCRLETKRKIILALGPELSESDKIFGNDVRFYLQNKGDQHGKTRIHHQIRNPTLGQARSPFRLSSPSSGCLGTEAQIIKSY